MGQLYNTGGLHSYEYRVTAVTGSGTTVIPSQIAYSDDTYEGIPADHVSAVNDAPNSGGAMKIYSDAYLSKANGSLLYGHWKAVSGGQIIMEEDIPADREGFTDIDIARTGYYYGSAPLTYAGTETVAIDGRTYDCTKYTYDVNGITRTAWYSPQAPMPVKLQWSSQGTTNTYELQDWR